MGILLKSIYKCWYKITFPPFAQLVIISHNYVKGERVCYFLVTFKDLSQKEDDLVSVKIKILNLRNALWWTSKKFWCNNLFATVTTPLTCFQTFFFKQPCCAWLSRPRMEPRAFNYFLYISVLIRLIFQWMKMVFAVVWQNHELSTLVYWAYLAKTWRHLLDTIYQEQIDSYLAH